MKKILSLHISKSVAKIGLFALMINVGMPLPAQESSKHTAQHAWSSVNKKRQQALKLLKSYSEKTNKKIRKFIACLEGDTCTQAEIRQARIYTGIIAAAITILLATAGGYAAWRTKFFGLRKRHKKPETADNIDYTETLALFAKLNNREQFQNYINNLNINLENINWNAKIDPNDPNSQTLEKWVLKNYDSMSENTKEKFKTIHQIAQEIPHKFEIEEVDLPELSEKEIHEAELAHKKRESKAQKKPNGIEILQEGELETLFAEPAFTYQDFEQEAKAAQTLISQAIKEREERIRESDKNGEESEPGEPQKVVEADINKPNPAGVTKLLRAVLDSNLDEVNRLLQQGADPNIKDNLGDYPLHVAASRGLTGITKMLIENKAKIDVLDKNNETPLQRAARGNSANMITILLKNGADSSRVDKDSNTILHFAAQGGNPEIYKIIYQELLNRGINPADSKNKRGKHPTETATGKLKQLIDTYNEKLQKIEKEEKTEEVTDLIKTAKESVELGDYQTGVETLNKIITEEKRGWFVW